jgi:hypothetical protein
MVLRVEDFIGLANRLRQLRKDFNFCRYIAEREREEKMKENIRTKERDRDKVGEK